jgi:hypothetical protein
MHPDPSVSTRECSDYTQELPHLASIHYYKGNLLDSQIHIPIWIYPENQPSNLKKREGSYSKT